jgi:hypothetical protein
MTGAVAGAGFSAGAATDGFAGGETTGVAWTDGTAAGAAGFAAGAMTAGFGTGGTTGRAGGGATASFCCVIAFRTSPGLEM